MEVKINREIRNYTETIFFGLTLRQFLCSIIGCILAIIIYFSFKDKLGLEITSWLCIIVVLPCAALGFIKYNGMNLEDFIVAFIKSEILTPKRIIFESSNLYYDIYEQIEKENYKHDKIISKYFKTRKRKNKNTKNS